MYNRILVRNLLFFFKNCFLERDYLKNESLDKRNVELPDPDSWKLVNTEVI